MPWRSVPAGEEFGFYCDVTDKGTIRRRHAGAFWVLKAGLATPERAAWENMPPETATRPKPVNSLRDYAGWGVIPAVVLPQMISNLKGHVHALRR